MEILVVFPYEDQSKQRVTELCGRVVQTLSKRVFVCEADGDPSSLKDAGGIVVASERDLDRLTSKLPSTERMFARAWLRKTLKSGKSRIGDGLEWDTPPFKAP